MLKIIVWLLISIVSAFFIIIFIPIRFKFKHRISSRFEVKILWLRFNFDFAEKDNKSRDSKTKNENQLLEFLKDFKNPKEFRNNLNKITSYINLMNDLVVFVISVVKKIYIKKLVLVLKISSDNPQNIAIDYAGISTAVYAIAAFLFNEKEPQEYFLSVSPDFLSHENEINFEISAKMRLYIIVHPCLTLLKKIITSKKYSHFKNLRRVQNDGKQR